MMAHEAEIIIPGSFVVLQGSGGDGVRNTMDSYPEWDPQEEEEWQREDQDAKNNHDWVVEPAPLQSRAGKPPPPLGLLATSTTPPNMPGYNDLATAGAASTQTPPDSNFVVVTDEPSTSPQQDRKRQAVNSKLFEEWNQACRKQELTKQADWQESVVQMCSNPDEHVFMRLRNSPQSQPEWWLSEGGRVAVLRELPMRLTNGTVLRSAVGTLGPGYTAVATDIVYLDSRNLRRLRVSPQSSSGGQLPHSIYPKGRAGWIVLIKLDSFQGHKGCYVTLSLDGYPLLAPGLPSYYVDPHVWIWRVTCPAGAFVREGLDLSTKHLDTLQYGALVRVTKRTVNGQGLSRLRVSAVVDEEHRSRYVDGWCSEFLNPLSGNRGRVLEPLALPIPALYRITLSSGAVVRSDVELSSPQVGVIPLGAIVRVVGRAFSENPKDRCLERLELAGRGGWISVRLNRAPPQDDLIVELVGVDSAYDPDCPGLYHWDCLREEHEKVHEVPMDTSGRLDLPRSGELSPVNSELSVESTNPSPRRRIDKGASGGPGGGPADKCLICLTEERTATIVHGETGHVACCLVCARILKARGDRCPVCRLEIDLVIQQFWA